MSFTHAFRSRVVGLLVAGVLPACSANSGSQAAECDLPNVPGEHCSSAHEMLLPSALPPAPGNSVADNEDAALFGFNMFFNSNVGKGAACVDCHAPELAFTDRLPVSKGKLLGKRNSPTVFNAARLDVFFWDGSADSLWSQPLFAVENEREMASTRLELSHFLAATPTAKQLYEAAFGALPDVSSWPAVGKPGDAAYDSLPADTKDQVNRVAANFGKGLEAYLRKLTTGAAAVDGFLKGDSSKLLESAQQGLRVFLDNDCQGCHSGPNFTDQKFHNVGFPSLPGAEPDRGRAVGLLTLENNIFNLAGPYADPGPGVPALVPTGPAAPDDEGAFRTPPLRNVARTFPYGHDGALPTLSDVLALHAPGLSEDDTASLMAFLSALNGDYPLPPWNDWPTRQ